MRMNSERKGVNYLASALDLISTLSQSPTAGIGLIWHRGEVPLCRPRPRSLPPKEYVSKTSDFKPAFADWAASKHPNHGEMGKSKTPNWELTGIQASRKKLTRLGRTHVITKME